MFNFDKFDRNIIYKNKDCILDDIIMSGFYDEFENLIYNIGTVNIVEEITDETKNYVICSKRDKTKLSDSKHYSDINIVKNLEYQKLLYRVSVINKEKKILSSDKIKTFIFYSVCITPLFYKMGHLYLNCIYV